MDNIIDPKGERELKKTRHKRQSIKRRGGVFHSGKKKGRLSQVVKISESIFNTENARKLFIPYLVTQVPRAVKVINESLEDTDKKIRFQAATFVIKTLLDLTTRKVNVINNQNNKEDSKEEIILTFKEANAEEKANS